MTAFLIYLFYRFAVALFRLLPLTWAFRLGWWGGAIAYHVMPRLRGIALSNLGIAYEGEKSGDEIAKIAHEHFCKLGANLISSIRMGTMTEAEIKERVDVEIPPEILERNHPEGLGWVAMLSHLGNWEIYSRLTNILPKYKLGAIYHPLRNRWINNHWVKERAAFGVQLFDRRAGLIKAAQFLKQGGVVGVLVDQHAGHAGVWAPLFDRLALTSPLAASLAIREAVPIVPLAVYTTGVARWRLIVSPAIETEGKDDPDLVTAEINQALEKQIRVNPSDWLWAHERWKVQRPHFLMGYHQRGLVVPQGYDLSRLKPFRILIAVPEENEICRDIIRIVKQSRPDAMITVLCSQKETGFWRECKEVEQSISRESVEAQKEIDEISFSAAILLQDDPETRRIIGASKIPVRVGRTGMGINEPVVVPEGLTQEEVYLKIAQAVGANVEGNFPVIRSV